LPESGTFTARIECKRLPWPANPPREAEALDENGNILRRLALKLQDGSTVLECDPAAFAYRLR
jgi:hypothetical protein